MIYIITHYVPNNVLLEEMFKLSSSHNKVRAEKLGWNFIADSKRRIPDRPIFREKAAIILETMEKTQESDKILWLDGDVLIIGNRTESIFDDLGNADIGMVKVRPFWNSGVVAMKVNKKIQDLWISIRDLNSKDWVDAQLESRIPTWVNESDPKVVELDVKWNSPKVPILNDGVEIVGFHISDQHRKLMNIKKTLKLINSNA